MMTASRVGSCVCAEGEEDRALEYLFGSLIERYGPPLVLAGKAYIGPDVDALLADVAREQKPPASSLALVRSTWEAASGNFASPSLVILFLTYPAVGLRPGEVQVEYGAESAPLPPRGPVQ